MAPKLQKLLTPPPLSELSAHDAGVGVSSEAPPPPPP